MRIPAALKRPRKSELLRFPAPTAGLISNRARALAENGPPGAAVMRNFFPTPTGCILRRGLEEVVDLSDPITSMFSYTSGGQQDMFAATEDTVWKLGTPDATVLTNQTSGDWHVVQFATAGGVFLIGVNGADSAFVYDGTSFTAASLTLAGGGAFPSEDLAFVWVYQQRLWFIEKDSLDAWYLPVDQVAGEMTKLPLGGVFVEGGTLQWGAAWSLDSGSSGGLSEQCVFATSNGEVAAYQGSDPGEASDWGKVGLYRIGRPMGPRGIVRAGGDILIATTVGLISLSSAARLDRAALGQAAVSHPIDVDWSELIQRRGSDGWRCMIWSEGQMLVVAPPRTSDQHPVVLVAHTGTGAWATFTGWDATALLIYKGRLYLGNASGKVVEAWVGGNDLGAPYVGEIAPLFVDGGAPASRKFPKLGRATYLSTVPANDALTALYDYQTDFGSVAPGGTPTGTGTEWGSAEWGTAVWGSSTDRRAFAEWRGLRGSGGTVSLGLQITSSESVPLDVEVVALDMMVQTGDMVT